jgi:hypothetical protein
MNKVKIKICKNVNKNEVSSCFFGALRQMHVVFFLLGGGGATAPRAVMALDQRLYLLFALRPKGAVETKVTKVTYIYLPQR